jgi:cytochrome c oxidase subunit II
MPFHFRPRRLAQAALTVALVVFIAACAQAHPESVFHHRTDVNRDVDRLFKRLIWLGTFVFVFVEVVLITALVKFRKRPGQAEPEHVHGNTTLEILWTVIPALILVMIAIPTVRTIFATQSPAKAGALQVDVIGHQWWWEFRYPDYNIVTANELYLPIGRTVNFTLSTQDVIHSFWVPALAGKRDLIARREILPNRVNHIWFTPDSMTASAWNGACVEYCGTSHGNMRFKAFTVSPADFESWAQHQQQSAVSPSGAATGAAAGASRAGAAATPRDTVTVAQVAQAGFIAFPREQLPAYAVPQTPLPAGLTFDDNLQGDAARGSALASGKGTCMVCHAIKGNPTMVGNIGPNLTHFATRTTLGAGLYPNDARHLARWIKNARDMKAGVIMPTLGAGQFDPTAKTAVKSGLSDQEIADIVAYLQTLK